MMTIQTILILYLTQKLKFSDSRADMLFGTYGSMLYLMPVFGGYLADRYIGFKQSILIGSAFLIFGYAIMGLYHSQFLFLGMSLVILGNGLFKPNVSSLVGELYHPNDSRRDGGFTIFYMGINIGSLLPSLFTGYLVDHYGWYFGFLSASFGLIIGFIVFFLFQRKLEAIGNIPQTSPLHNGRRNKIGFYLIFSLGVIILLCLLQILFIFPKETNIILIILSIAILISVLFFLFKESPEQQRKLSASLILILISIGFWSIYMQTWTSLMLFAQRNMTKEFLSIPINAEFTQFFNPFFILLLSPVLSRLWLKLDEKRKNPSIPTKFTLGLFFMSLGFFVLGAGIYFFQTGGEASVWWLIASYFLQTTGELLLSPIGLAMITRLAPKHLTGMMMGVWFLSLSAAFAIGGTLATIANVPAGTSVTESMHIYVKAFIYFGIIAAACGIVSWILVPFIKKLIEEPKEPLHTPKE